MHWLVYFHLHIIYPDLDYLDQTDLIDVLQEIYREYKIPFVFIIDEWDCIFRENKNDMEAQKKSCMFKKIVLYLFKCTGNEGSFAMLILANNFCESQFL